MTPPRLAVAVACLLGMLSLVACGGASRPGSDRSAHRFRPARPAPTPTPTPSPLPTPAQMSCTVSARNAMASYLRVAASTISESASIANDGYPQCLFRARLHRSTVDALVQVYSGPQPHFLLVRTENEDSQGWPKLNHPPPSAVLGLGLEADWFPSIRGS
jgi:hypothetical protein